MTKFVRFGGLSPVIHKGYNDEETYHYCPKKKGIYAFVDGYIETFLIGSTLEPYHSNKSAWLRDDEGNLISDEECSYDTKTDKYIFTDFVKKVAKKRKIKLKDIREYQTLKTLRNKEKHCKIYEDCDECPINGECNKCFLAYTKKPKKFEYDGDIWHHLLSYVNEDDIIETNGVWIKTTMKVFKKAFNKCKHADFRMLSSNHNLKIWKKEDDYVSCNGYVPCNPYKGANGFVSLDHLEVFIERIK